MTGTTQLSLKQLIKLTAKHPDLPEDYVTYLREVGWGEAASGRQIYQAPISPEDVFGPEIVVENVLLLGDDFQGYCLAWHRENHQYGELSDSGVWEPWSAEEGIEIYVRAEEHS